MLTNDPLDPPQLLPDRAVNWQFASWRGGIPRDGQAADASRTPALKGQVFCWTYAWVDLTDWQKCLEQALTGFPERGNKQRKRSKTQSLTLPMVLCEIVLPCVNFCGPTGHANIKGHVTNQGCVLQIGIGRTQTSKTP